MKVIKVYRGFVVIKYEVYFDMGVKVSKIVSLSDDLVFVLVVKDICIEVLIFGKLVVGIEVLNLEVLMVMLREVFDFKVNNYLEEKLLIGFGWDIIGEVVLVWLNKMFYLFVVGVIGSGKSVCINGIIVSILMCVKLYEVKLMMIDLKMVELNVYNGVFYLLMLVVIDLKKVL